MSTQPIPLSKRERQLMDAVYQLGEATAAQIRERIPKAPTDAAVRRMLAILEEKGHLCHTKRGRTFVYQATQPIEAARDVALNHMKKTFFSGSAFSAVATMLDLAKNDLSENELSELAELIDKAKGEE